MVFALLLLGVGVQPTISSARNEKMRVSSDTWQVFVASDGAVFRANDGMLATVIMQNPASDLGAVTVSGTGVTQLGIGRYTGSCTLGDSGPKPTSGLLEGAGVAFQICGTTSGSNDTVFIRLDFSGGANTGTVTIDMTRDLDLLGSRTVETNGKISTAQIKLVSQSPGAGVPVSQGSPITATFQVVRPVAVVQWQPVEVFCTVGTDTRVSRMTEPDGTVTCGGTAQPVGQNTLYTYVNAQYSPIGGQVISAYANFSIAGNTTPTVPQCTINQTPTNPVQIGSSVSLKATCQSGADVSPIATYTWRDPADIPVGVNSDTLQFAAPAGGGTYRLRVTNQAGLSAEFSHAVSTSAPAMSSALPNSSVNVPGLNGTPVELKVKVATALGAGLPGIAVSWVASAGAGNLAQASSMTDAQGIASNTFTPQGNGGGRTVTASALGAQVVFKVQDVVQVVQQPAQQVSAATVQTAVAAPQAQLANVRSRLDQLRITRGPTSSANVKVAAQGTAVPMERLADLILGQPEKGQRGGGASADDFQRWGVFVNGSVDIGKYSPRTGAQGSEISSKGITAGADYRFAGNHVLGAGLGFMKGDSDLGAQGGQDTKGYSLSVYGSIVPSEKMYLDLALNWGRNDYDTRRHVLSETGVLLGTASSNNRSKQLALSASLGADLYLAQNALRLTPYARAEYVKVDIDGFEESGSTQNLRVGANGLKSTSAAAGLNGSYALSTSFGVVMPTARLEWIWSSRDARAGVLAQLVSDPTVQSELLAASEDNSYGAAGLGVTVQFPRGVSTFINYEQSFARSYTRNRRWDFGLRIPF